jgi:hypothetical protein
LAARYAACLWAAEQYSLDRPPPCGRSGTGIAVPHQLQRPSTRVAWSVVMRSGVARPGGPGSLARSGDHPSCPRSCLRRPLRGGPPSRMSRGRRGVVAIPPAVTQGRNRNLHAVQGVRCALRPLAPRGEPSFRAELADRRNAHSARGVGVVKPHGLPPMCPRSSIASHHQPSSATDHRARSQPQTYPTIDYRLTPDYLVMRRSGVRFPKAALYPA